MTSPAAAPETGTRRPAGLAIVLPFCLGYFVSYVLRAVNAVIAPELQSELGLDAAGLGFLTSTYSLAFALGQLPVGLALDRFGARRVVGSLLLVATLGTIAFATGRSVLVLSLGRGLAGLGVSACLMGAFKIFGESFPQRRQASLTGLIMAAGSSGALVASAPLAWALPIVGWRGALLMVAGVSAAAAALVLLVVPAAPVERANEPLGAQLRGLWAVVRTRPFWRYAPQTTLFTGGFMALQGLWVTSWLMNVDGLPRGQAAAVLFALNLGLLAGQAAITLGATALHAAGLTRARLMHVGLALAVGVEALLVSRVVRHPAGWFAFGVFSAAGAQVYGLASARFPAALAGRVTTALNLLAFTGAFVIQWGVGVAVAVLGGGGRALQGIFAVICLAQAAAVTWAIAARDG
jgi:predicted MFS family arabinose efflux permease